MQDPGQDYYEIGYDSLQIDMTVHFFNQYGLLMKGVVTEIHVDEETNHVLACVVNCGYDDDFELSPETGNRLFVRKNISETIAGIGQNISGRISTGIGFVKTKQFRIIAGVFVTALLSYTIFRFTRHEATVHTDHKYANSMYEIKLPAAVPEGKIWIVHSIQGLEEEKIYGDYYSTTIHRMKVNGSISTVVPYTDPVNVLDGLTLKELSRKKIDYYTSGNKLEFINDHGKIEVIELDLDK